MTACAECQGPSPDRIYCSEVCVLRADVAALTKDLLEARQDVCRCEEPVRKAPPATVTHRTPKPRYGSVQERLLARFQARRRERGA